MRLGKLSPEERKRIGGRFRELYHEAGLSRTYVGRILDISRTKVYHMEEGKSPFSVRDIDAVVEHIAATRPAFFERGGGKKTADALYREIDAHFNIGLLPPYLRPKTPEEKEALRVLAEDYSWNFPG